MRLIELAKIAVLSFCLAVLVGEAAAQEMPPFLKPYYAPLFTPGGKPLHLTGHSEQNNFTHYAYTSDDLLVSLTIDYYPCNSDLCRTVYGNGIKITNEQAGKALGGRFLVATDSEYRADWRTGVTDIVFSGFRLPTSLQFWTYSSRIGNQSAIEAAYQNLKSAVNRQRYEDAFVLGNIEVGRWNGQVRSFAGDLLMQGQKPIAVVVLENLLSTAPFDFEAHMTLARNTTDATAAENSAMAVLDNAESPELLAQAAQFLQVIRPTISSLPLLDKNEHGLQVILVPLGDPDVTLLAEAAKIY